MAETANLQEEADGLTNVVDKSRKKSRLFREPLNLLITRIQMQFFFFRIKFYSEKRMRESYISLQTHYLQTVTIKFM